MKKSLLQYKLYKQICELIRETYPGDNDLKQFKINNVGYDKIVVLEWWGNRRPTEYFYTASGEGIAKQKEIYNLLLEYSNL